MADAGECCRALRNGRRGGAQARTMASVDIRAWAWEAVVGLGPVEDVEGVGGCKEVEDY